jgi:hypothetical protein
MMTTRQILRGVRVCSVLLLALACPAAAQTMKPADATNVPGIIPSGFGDAVDRDVARVRDATAPFKDVEKAIAAGYPRTSDCVEHQPHGAMGFHHNNKALFDATLEVDKPEVLVYERLKDGTYRLNGIEYLVPISAWTREEPPTIMGQKLKRADKLGIWYLHVWIWEHSPTGIFADWNPRVKCGA